MFVSLFHLSLKAKFSTLDKTIVEQRKSVTVYTTLKTLKSQLKNTKTS